MMVKTIHNDNVNLYKRALLGYKSVIVTRTSQYIYSCIARCHKSSGEEMRMYEESRLERYLLRRAIEQDNYVTVKKMITNNEFLIHSSLSVFMIDYPVHVAVCCGQRRILKLLLNRGADPNTKNKDQQTPAHLCVLHCKHQLLQLLMINGADLTAVNDINLTPLEQAIQFKKKHCLNVLLNCNMPKNVANKGFFCAMLINSKVLMNKLLNRKADIDYKDKKSGCTALLYAMKFLKNIKIIQFLLEKGANPAVYDKARWTCLHIAVFFKFPDDILFSILKKYTAIENMIDFQTVKMETAVHLAVDRGNLNAIFGLFTCGANMNLLDAESRTPLLIALDSQNYIMAQFIIMFGASPNRIPGSTEEPPLSKVVTSNNVLLAQLMLKFGAMVVDIHNDDLNWTVIHKACYIGNDNMLKSLLTYTEPAILKMLHKTGQSSSPLIVAISMGNVTVVDVLLNYGVNVNTRYDNGKTALHMAVQLHKQVIVKQLIDAGAYIDAQIGEAKRRPLDVSMNIWGRNWTMTSDLIHSNRLVKAVLVRDLHTINVLLSCGVSPNISTKEFGSLLHVAVRHRQYDIIMILLSSRQCRTDIQHNGVTPLDYARSMNDIFATDMIEWRERRLYSSLGL